MCNSYFCLSSIFSSRPLRNSPCGQSCSVLPVSVLLTYFLCLKSLVCVTTVDYSCRPACAIYF